MIEIGNKEQLLITVRISKEDVFEMAAEQSGYTGLYNDTFEKRLTVNEKEWFFKNLIMVCRNIYPQMSAYLKNVYESLAVVPVWDNVREAMIDHLVFNFAMGNNYDANNGRVIESKLTEVLKHEMLARYYLMTREVELAKEQMAQGEGMVNSLMTVLHSRKGRIRAVEYYESEQAQEYAYFEIVQGSDCRIALEGINDLAFTYLRIYYFTSNAEQQAEIVTQGDMKFALLTTAQTAAMQKGDVISRVEYGITNALFPDGVENIVLREPIKARIV